VRVESLPGISAAVSGKNRRIASPNGTIKTPSRNDQRQPHCSSAVGESRKDNASATPEEARMALPWLAPCTTRISELSLRASISYPAESTRVPELCCRC
jgi:hypothetical protein